MLIENPLADELPAVRIAQMVSLQRKRPPRPIFEIEIYQSIQNKRILMLWRTKRIALTAQGKLKAITSKIDLAQLNVNGTMARRPVVIRKLLDYPNIANRTLCFKILQPIAR